MTANDAARVAKVLTELLAKVEAIDDDEQAERAARAFEADGVRAAQRVLHQFAFEMESDLIAALQKIEPSLAIKIARRNCRSA